MNTLLHAIEAFLILGLGLLMAWLPLSEYYWQFLNPKYGWVTFAAGVVLVVLAIGAALHGDRKRKWSELVALSLVLALAGTTLYLPNAFTSQQEPEAADPAWGSLTTEYDAFEEDEVATISLDGHEYIKMNLAELLAGEQTDWVSAGTRYAAQGMILRNEKLDAAGYIVVVRLLITCCFADASGVALIVKVDDPTLYTSGEWVRVAGTLLAIHDVPEVMLSVTGALSTMQSQMYALQAEDVMPEDMPDIPFIFEIRDKQPHAY